MSNEARIHLLLPLHPERACFRVYVHHSSCSLRPFRPTKRARLTICLLLQELNTSVLEAWTKGFDTGHATNDPVVGKDVVVLLTEAIRRRNLGVECAAVVNDTVSSSKLTIRSHKTQMLKHLAAASYTL